MFCLEKNNMINRQDLLEIGFTGFEHLVKSKRDGKERLTWVGIAKGIGLTVLLVRNDSVWEVEKIKLDDEDHLLSLSTVSDVVGFIRAHGTVGDIEP